MNSAASVTQFAHKCILEYFSLLIGTLVRTKVRYNTEDSDCKRGDNLLQRGTIYSKVDYPRGPPTLGARLLRDISYQLLTHSCIFLQLVRARPPQ